MNYAATAIPAPNTGSSQSSDRIAAWLLAGLLIAALAGFLGWLVAHEQQPSWGDIENSRVLVEQTGQLRGQDAGYRAGLKAGRSEGKYETTLAELKNGGPVAYNSGYRAGLQASTNNAALSDTGAYDLPNYTPSDDFAASDYGTGAGWASAAYAGDDWGGSLDGSDYYGYGAGDIASEPVIAAAADYPVEASYDSSYAELGW